VRHRWLSSTIRMRPLTGWRAGAADPTTAAGAASPPTISPRQGSRTTNSEPAPPPALNASMLPPCICTSRRARVKPTPRPPCVRSSPRAPCVNRSKTCGQQLRLDADAMVAHANHRAIALDARVQLDLRALLAVLRRVVQQVGDDLREPREVAVQPQRLRERAHVQRLAACFEVRLRRLDAVRDHRIEVDLLALEHDLALADACDVEQLLDEPRHLAQLPIHDVRRPGELRVGRGDAAGHFERSAESARAGCATRARASRGTRPCGGWPLGVRLRSAPLDDLELQALVEPRVLERCRGTRRQVAEEAPVGLLPASVRGDQQHAVQAVAAQQRQGRDGAPVGIERVGRRVGRVGNVGNRRVVAIERTEPGDLLGRHVDANPALLGRDQRCEDGCVERRHRPLGRARATRNHDHVTGIALACLRVAACRHHRGHHSGHHRGHHDSQARQLWHDQASQRAQADLHVQRAVQHTAGVGEKARAPVVGLGNPPAPRRPRGAAACASAWRRTWRCIAYSRTNTRTLLRRMCGTTGDWM